jgi:hypothetical protein
MRDPKTEQFLTNGAWKWKYHERVPFSEIDLKASRENPSRLLGKLDEDRVCSYGLAMERGDKFPPLVLLGLDPATSAFKYLIATGCHRQAAADLCGLDGFDAYVVHEADQYRQEVLIRQLNTIEGYGVTPRDQVLQILHLFETYPGHSLQTLAKEWNLKHSMVKNVAAEQAAIKRARSFGYEFPKNAKFPTKGIMVALNGIHSDATYQKTLDLVTMHSGVTSAEADEVIREVKKTRTDEAAFEVVERHIEALDSRKKKDKAKHGRIKATQAGKFFQDARRLNNLLDKGIEKLHLSAHPDRPSAAILAQELIDNLKRVIADIERIERIERPVATKARPPEAGLGLH